jgi:hypothetical protein
MKKSRNLHNFSEKAFVIPRNEESKLLIIKTLRFLPTVGMTTFLKSSKDSNQIIPITPPPLQYTQFADSIAALGGCQSRRGFGF